MTDALRNGRTGFPAAYVPVLNCSSGRFRQTLGMSSDHGPDDDADTPPEPPSFDTAVFHKWRSPRFGRANPERLNNPVWEWLVRTRLNAYQANQICGGPSSFEAGPCWCFDRFGQSESLLPDGRTLLIGGEHEDFYDPDFYIYNDVVVKHPDGRLDIFGYPREEFPPTDFHSATVVGNEVILIGNLGYPDDRRPSVTQVFRLDLATVTIAPLATSGTPPGWIHKHQAELSADGRAIVVLGGKLDTGDPDLPLLENLDEWRLDLCSLRWERLTERRWPRALIRRCDRQPLHLFEYQQALWTRQFPELAKLPALLELEALKDEIATPPLADELGREPDLELFARLFRPATRHEEIPRAEAEEYGVHRVRVAGAGIRFNEDSHAVTLTVEGQVAQALVSSLAEELRDKLATLENAPCEVVWY